MGLEWQDIDLKTGISQYKSVLVNIFAEKGVFTKAPKTESSIRDVAIPDFIVSLLEEYKLWYDEQKSIVWRFLARILIGYLFKTDGKPIHPSTISKWFVTIC